MLTRNLLSIFFPIFAAVLLNAYLREPIAWSITTNGLNKPLVIVLVDSEIFNGIQFFLQQYKEDVEKSGFSTKIAQTNEMSNGTKEGVREYLQRLLTQNLVGALLVGDIPEAWYEVGSDRFLTDVYYMDLDERWIDTDGNGIYDKHNEKLSLEIWVGRLKVSTVSGDEVFVVNNYFEKNHRYRNQLISIPWRRALLYIDDPGLMLPDPRANPLTSLSYIATEIVAVNDSRTTSADYKQRLQDEVGYHWLYLMCHGTANNHTFLVSSKEMFYEWDGTVYSSDYQTLNPHVFFYHFFVCSAGKYTEQNYLAGSAVFANTYGLLAIASTYNAYTFPFDSFYKALSEQKTIGAAFLQWLNGAITEHDQQGTNMLNGEQDYEVLFHDTVIIGDPTLQLYRENHDIALTDLTVFSKNVLGTETLIITFSVENAGDFTEIFNVTVFFDSEIMYRTELTLAPKKNETINYSPKESSRYVWSDSIYHKIEVQISILEGEFNVSNNFRSEYFQSKIIENWLPRQLPEVLFAMSGILILGATAVSFLKILMSDRPLYFLQKGYTKMLMHIKKMVLKRSPN